MLDLWSIFDFLMPGYLGTAKDFRALRVAHREGESRSLSRGWRARLQPICAGSKAGSGHRSAGETRTGFVHELTPDQRGVYQQVIEASRKEVLEAVGAQGVAKSRMVALTALLRLRSR